MSTPTRTAPVAPETPEPPSTSHTPRPEPAPRSAAAIGWAFTLIAVGTLWLLDVLGVTLPWELLLPLAVVAVGLALVGLSFSGGHPGLITLGVALSVVAAVSGVLGGPLSASAGERIHRPATVSELQTGYALGMGTMTIDLRDLDLAPGTTTLTASVTMGELVIHPPDDVRVVLTADVGAGEITAYDRVQSGLGPDLDGTFGPESARTLEIDASVAMGSIEVTP